MFLCNTGTLVKSLDQAQKRGWLLVDMAKHWNQVWSGKR